jgi:hypothetical protein
MLVHTVSSHWIDNQAAGYFTMGSTELVKCGTDSEVEKELRETDLISQSD